MLAFTICLAKKLKDTVHFCMLSQFCFLQIIKYKVEYGI